LGEYVSQSDIVILISLNFKKFEAYYNRIFVHDNVAENPAPTIPTYNKHIINKSLKLEGSVTKRP
jgi:hypothetical protein